MKIQQGDQYAIPVKIKSGDMTITPEDCTDVRIKISDSMLSYKDEEVTFNPIDQTWCFPLTEELSFGLNHLVNIQVGVKFGDDYLYSPVQTIEIGTSIIKDAWDGN